MMLDGKGPSGCLVGEPYKFDVFISYSHGRIKGSLAEDLKKWSARFVELLDTELQIELSDQPDQPESGRTVNVYFDEDDRRGRGVSVMTPLPEHLRGAVGRSAILTVLMSHYYLDSAWCKNELEWWLEEQRNLGYDFRSRTTIARIWDTRERPWPDWLKPLKPTEFFDPKTRRPLDWPMPPLNEKTVLRDRVVAMAGEILAQLRVLRDDLEEYKRQDELNNKRKEAKNLSFYLYARIENLAKWEQIRDELVGQGFSVAPRSLEEIGSDTETIQRQSVARVADMVACDAVLLLATEDDKALGEDITAIGSHDRAAASDSKGASLPCAIVNTSNGKAETPNNRMKARMFGINWLGMGPEPLVPRLLQWLAEFKE